MLQLINEQIKYCMKHKKHSDNARTLDKLKLAKSELLTREKNGVHLTNEKINEILFELKAENLNNMFKFYQNKNYVEECAFEFDIYNFISTEKTKNYEEHKELAFKIKEQYSVELNSEDKRVKGKTIGKIKKDLKNEFSGFTYDVGLVSKIITKGW